MDRTTLAKPEGQHIATPQANIGNFTDTGFFEVQDSLAHGTMGVENDNAAS